MRIVIVGFFGEGNLGDEAILSGLAAALPPGAEPVVAAGAGGLPLPNARRIPRRGLAGFTAFLRELPAAGRVVFTGGLLQDWSFEGVTFYALRLLAARFFRRRCGLWGTGLGPLRRQTARALAAKVLHAVDTAWFRDDDARSLYQQLSGHPGQLGADWSWLVHPLDRIEPVNNPSPAGHRLAINLRPWRDPLWQNAATARFQALPSSTRTTTIAARAEDHRLLTTLFPQLPHEDPASFAALLTQAHRGAWHEAWTMRYHVTLALLRARTPIVPFPYDDKVRSLCLEAGLDPTAPPATRPPQPAAADFTIRLTTRTDAMKTAFHHWLC